MSLPTLESPQAICHSLDISIISADLLQNKAGIRTFRLALPDGATAILKQFDSVLERREVANYRLLKSLGIPTLKVLAESASAIVLEDLQTSPHRRLGREADMDSASIAVCLANWYRRLHSRGVGIPELDGLYSELDYLTQDWYARVKTITGTAALPIWKTLEANADKLSVALKRLPRTLTYNDFYWVNLAVQRDEKQALMFDYNLLGAGFPEMDLQNVCASLTPNAGAAFREAYGPSDPMEAAAYEIVSPLASLAIGLERSPHPGWWVEALKEVISPEFEVKVLRFISSA